MLDRGQVGRYSPRMSTGSLAVSRERQAGPPLIVSIGYEGRRLSDFVDLLRAWGVRRVLDIRELPLSRRPDFRKGALTRSLASAGIEYVHIRAAGNPFRKMKADTEACLRAYRGHLRRTPAVIPFVERSLGSEPVALLCFEREHDRCHRSVLLREMEESGMRVPVISL